MRTPPQAPPCFANITVAAIDEEVESILKDSAALRDHLAATLTPSTATFANLVRPLLDDTNRAKRRTVILGVLLARVSVDPEVRQASRNAQKRISDAETRNLLRSDIASLVAAVSEKEKDSIKLDDEDRYVLAHLHGQFIRSGANVSDDAKRARLEEAQSEINEINAAAIKGFSEANEGIWFTRSEIAGCPETWLATLKIEKQEDEKLDRFWVTFRDDHYVHIIQSATSEDTRRRIFLAAQRRFPENIERLSKAVVLRDEIARVVGYEHHAALRMENTMLRSVEMLQERLLSLYSKLSPLAKTEIATLLALKKAELESSSVNRDMIDNSPEIYVWDRAYYANIQEKREFAVDNAKVSEYFEVNHIVLEMLKIFEELFGMDFILMPDLDTWHDSVSSFAVWDSATEGGSFLGYLYLDIFGRPGKFSAQYHSRIQQGFFDVDGVRHYPVSALVCSYPESTPERPSLLQHRDVRILFHELGHAIHHLVGRTKYATGQSRDFGEIPSKMLEHFIWIPEVMVRLSRHYKTLPAFSPSSSGQNSTDVEESATIPLDLARAVARTKTLNDATGMVGSVQRALFDLAIYTPKTHEEAMGMDLTAMWNKAQHIYLPYKYPENEKLFGLASFSSFFRGYDAAFFTYAMSEAYAADLYQAAFANDPLSPEAGRRWRYEVLERNSSQPELELMEKFLGRPVSFNAIFEQIVCGQRP